MKEIAKEIRNDYINRLDNYEKAAVIFALINDTEMYELCIKKAAGCKLMLDSGEIEKFM